jgi:hypothetical protein
MKKISIKLKMPTQEELAIKQQKLAEDKAKKQRAPRKPAVPRQPKVVKPAQQIAPQNTPGQPVPNQPKPVEVTQHDIPKPDPFTHSYAMPPTQPVSQTMADPSLAAQTLPSMPQPSEVVQNGMQGLAIAKEPLSYAPPPPTMQHPTHAYVVPESPTHPQFHSQDHQPTEQTSVASTSTVPVKHPTYPLHELQSNAPEPGALDAPPLEMMTPNKRTVNDLPVFTSQSRIPFGSPVTPQHNLEAKEEVSKHKPSIWDIPETPQHNG